MGRTQGKNMHRRIDEADLEEYLAGTASASLKAEVEAHLASNAAARAEVDEMLRMQALFAELRAPEASVQPSPGFYARVSGRIEDEMPAPSVWSMLFEPVWTRRVAFAALTLFAALGTALITRESEYANGPTPEMIMALDNEVSPLDARDRVFLTLVSYE
jgi:anti-sigma factor RsiW